MEALRSAAHTALSTKLVCNQFSSYIEGIAVHSVFPEFSHSKKFGADFCHPAFRASSKSRVVSLSSVPATSDNLKDLASLVADCQVSINNLSQEDALKEGSWTKLICGASFEDVADVRDLSLVYALAGVDCIDCAADIAVVAAVTEGIEAAREISQNLLALEQGPGYQLIGFRRPWVMVSVNDDEDPHFRKAAFDASRCPPTCPRPCEAVCPASAIRFSHPAPPGSRVRQADPQPVAPTAPAVQLTPPMTGGVVTERCYGCGRCMPVCPLGLIAAKSYVRSTEATAELLRGGHVDAIEIHTRPGHLAAFQELWRTLGAAIQPLRLVAVSIPDLGPDMPAAMKELYAAMCPPPSGLTLWQLDGRPMSGDIGRGITRAAVQLASRVAAFADRPPGFIQLAGGTNAHTVPMLQRLGLLSSPSSPGPDAMSKHSFGQAAIGGIAYGGYARKIVSPFLRAGRQDMQETSASRLSSAPAKPSTTAGRTPVALENDTGRLIEALTQAMELFQPLKKYRKGE